MKANDFATAAGYYQQMMNGAMTQLVRIEPGKDIEEAIEAETSGDLQKAYLTLGK